MEETRPIPLRNVIPFILTDDRQVKELKEDLRAMGCIGLLSRPWNLQVEDALREFLFERGNQFEGTKRRAPESWTPDTWAKVYGIQPECRGRMTRTQGRVIFRRI